MYKRQDGENIKNEEAKSFLNGLERRQQTLLMVSEYIVEAQKEFLRSASDKKAISNKEIANRLGISPSTVSRIVRNKFIQFPEKLIPLGQLMERRINKHNEGADVTEESLKSLILEMIKKEDKKNPFSDQTLSRPFKKDFASSFFIFSPSTFVFIFSRNSLEIKSSFNIIIQLDPFGRATTSGLT